MELRQLTLFTLLLSLSSLFSGGCTAGKDELRIYVSPDEPNSFHEAIKKASSHLMEDGLPGSGIRIIVKEGVYHFTEPLVLGEEFRGSEAAPIIIRAEEDAEVLFDGSMSIDPLSFSKVSDPEEKNRLAASAADDIYVAEITDPALVKRLSSKLMLNLSMDGKEYLPSVFPNEGYASFNIRTVTPEVTPPAVPVGKEDYGVRAGQPPYQERDKDMYWKGTLDEPRGARAGFDEKEDEMAGSWEQWEKEIGRNNTRNQLTGFIEANWLLSSQPIYAASGEDKCVHLSRALGYGWAWRDEKPFRVFGLLCELDQSDEWHFDPLSNRLYIYPTKPVTEESIISLSLAQGFLELDKCSHVQVIGLSVKNVGGGTIYKIGGEHNLVASCTISNSTASGVELTGKNNSIKGCDLFDLNFHLALSGGIRSPEEITPGQNMVENCHFYQEHYSHEKVNISIKDVGNIFRHNLVHNSIGQSIVVNGNDHLIELNELFNVGYNEGDGGAIYAGADFTGYGVVYRYNFFHHLMGVPGKVERSGIHLDDGQSGATCIGNVFYKSAAKGIHTFCGAGNTLIDNVFLEGYRGAWIHRADPMKGYNLYKEMQKNPEHDRIGSKEDPVGRAEAVTGKKGWENPPWSEKYPLFKEIMSDTGIYGRFWPIKHRLEGNCYYGNQMPIDPGDKRIVPEVRETWTITGQKEVKPEDFVDYTHMDFQPKEGSGLPDIPFTEIGLKVDEYRSQMPDKNTYRNAIKDFFEGIPSMPGTTKQFDSSKTVK